MKHLLYAGERQGLLSTLVGSFLNVVNPLSVIVLCKNKGDRYEKRALIAHLHVCIVK